MDISSVDSQTNEFQSANCCCCSMWTRSSAYLFILFRIQQLGNVTVKQFVLCLRERVEVKYNIICSFWGFTEKLFEWLTGENRFSLSGMCCQTFLRSPGESEHINGSKTLFCENDVLLKKKRLLCFDPRGPPYTRVSEEFKSAALHLLQPILLQRAAADGWTFSLRCFCSHHIYEV